MSIANRQKRARLWAALLTLCVVAAFAVSGRNIGRADMADAWWLRARFSLREWLLPTTVDPEIVLVEIDDRSLGHWKEPFILWGPHLAAAIERVTRGGAKVIGLDWVQPIRVDDYFPGHDAPLSAALSKAPNVVMAKEFQRDGTPILPSAELLMSIPGAALNPEAYMGYAELPQGNSIVATARPALQAGSDKLEVSFPARIAEHAARTTYKLDGETWKDSSNADPSQGIKLRSDGTYLINYRNGTGAVGRAAAFEHFSLFDLAQSTKQVDTRFKDKIVLIGATFAGSNDSHFVSFLNGLAGSRLVPGVEIQANVLRTVLSSNEIHEPKPWTLVLMTVLVTFVSIVGWLRLPYMGAGMVSAGVIVLWVVSSIIAFIWFNYALPAGVPMFCVALATVSMGGFRALVEERERRAVLGLWGRYQDPRIVDYLLEHPEARGGQGYETEVTVLFADLKNFTKTVEHLDPAAALQVLNRYLALMTDIIRDEFGGIVDKYLGDGLLAQWGAPQPWDAPRASAGEHHATKAVRACLELHKRATAMTATMDGAKDVAFGLRLTLHTGPVVVGWVGAEKIEFTIIGDTVNVCARLQETAKELGCEFLLSESTYAHVAPLVQIGKQSQVEIRGRDKPLVVFEIVGGEIDADGGSNGLYYVVKQEKGSLE